VQVFASAPFPSSGAQVSVVAETFTLDGAAWEAQVRPRDEVIAERLRSARSAVWILGLLFALAAGGAAGAAAWRARGWARPFTFGAAARPSPGAYEVAPGGRTLQDQKMETVRRFVDGILEQINNPLCTILGYSQLLLARDVPADIKSRLETVHGEAARIARVIKDLLTFAGKQPPEIKVLGLNGLIEKTLETKARHFETAHIKVEKDLDPELPMSRLDFHQIQRALLNLLDNAEQALTESGRGGTIQVCTRRAGERVEATITDDGPGIPAEIRDRIFEPFFTTRAAVGRAGLGLSLCYGIIREHGGSLRVESAAGGGARFIMDLPVAVGARERAPAGAASDGRLPRLRILVVDDEPALQDLLVDLLTARGHRVDTASDVPEALRKISGQDHDLIIADFRMPHGSGKDIYRAVVEKAPALAGRIIFTSGEGASRETQEFVQDIGNEILFKPYGIAQIEQAIARATRN
jgi:signal transduction histidine kinase